MDVCDKKETSQTGHNELSLSDVLATQPRDLKKTFFWKKSNGFLPKGYRISGEYSIMRLFNIVIFNDDRYCRVYSLFDHKNPS